MNSWSGIKFSLLIMEIEVFYNSIQTRFRWLPRFGEQIEQYTFWRFWRRLNIVQNHCSWSRHFKNGPGAFDLKCSFRLLMVQDHIVKVKISKKGTIQPVCVDTDVQLFWNLKYYIDFDLYMKTRIQDVQIYSLATFITTEGWWFDGFSK